MKLVAADVEHDAGTPAERSDAITAQHGLGVGQLAWMLHQKTRLADELAGLFGKHLLRSFGPVLGVRRFVVLIAPDEERTDAYCDRCHPLSGAAVTFLAFDQPTPELQRRRERRIP